MIQLTIAREQEHKTIFQTAAEQFYDDIYEIDISHDRPASEATVQYFKRLGIPEGATYRTALNIISELQVKKQYQQGYLDTFSPEAVLEAFEEGKEALCYEFLHSDDGVSYYWMRITAHLFKWKDDNSVRMLVCHQNIDAEKKREQIMLDKMQRDSLTGLYNKASTQEHIHARLESGQEQYAFFILDIDKFKQVNDQFGHATGDHILTYFADIVRRQFRKDDITGRIGGDEFAAFMALPDRETAEKKARELVSALCFAVNTDAGVCRVTTSIGVAVTPLALYQTKKKGGNGFTIFHT